MSQKTTINQRKGGVVTFLDVLGWKGVYDRHADAPNILRMLIQGVEAQAKGKRGRINGDVLVKSISDTVALFTSCSEAEACEGIEIHGELCQWLIPRSIEATLPMRGTTAYGEFDIRDNIFVGKGVDEAASWHEQSNWIGVNLSPSAEFVFSPKRTGSAWVRYSVPLKVSMKWDPHCVDWTKQISTIPGMSKGVASIKDKFRNMGPIIPEIAPKFVNTLAFLNSIGKAMVKPRRK